MRDTRVTAWGVETPGRRRLALVREGRSPAVLAVEETRPDRPGLLDAIVTGRVVRRLPGGVLVALPDQETPGFLGGGRVMPDEGAAVTVQVVAEGYGDKGPRLSDRPRLPGGLGMLTVDTGDWRPRPAAAGVPEAAVAAERAHLTALATTVRAGDPVPPLASTETLLRDEAPPGTRVCLPAGAWRQAVAAWAEQHRPDLVLAPPVADAEAWLDEAVTAALAPVVPLAGGAELVIEPTAALVAVDVNAGARPVGETNHAALTALGGALRLRDLGGQVVVDLIRGGGRPGRLLETLGAAIADDPQPVHVHGFGPLGLLELVRERRRAPLAVRLGDAATREALAALAQAHRTALADPAWRPRLTVSPAAAARLAGPLRPAHGALARQLGGALPLDPC